MRRMRAALAGGIVIGMLALAGCAGESDVSGLQDELSQVDGVNGALVWPSHPGAPWNTQINVTLFLEEGSTDAVVAAAQAAAPVLAADPAASRHDVTIAFVEAGSGQFTRETVVEAPTVTVMPEAYERLGLAEGSPYMVTLRPGEAAAIPGGS